VETVYIILRSQPKFAAVEPLASHRFPFGSFAHLTVCASSAALGSGGVPCGTEKRRHVQCRVLLALHDSAAGADFNDLKQK
jgi:hypothetical protein